MGSVPLSSEEVISCSVESAGTGRFFPALPNGRIRLLPVREVHEVRVAELATELLQLRVTLDSGGRGIGDDHKRSIFPRLRLERNWIRDCADEIRA